MKYRLCDFQNDTGFISDFYIGSELTLFIQNYFRATVQANCFTAENLTTWQTMQQFEE